jgi:DNA polymerase-3 subunit alpha
LRLAETEPWSRAEQMTAERETFGFYFAAHPVEQYRLVASARGARSYQSLMEGGVAGGGRQQAVMAVMVEGVSKGRTRKGRDFVRADFSDSTGQFSAACFEEGLVENFQRWAAESTCVLLTVELDAPSPDEPPRVTVRGAQPLADVTSAAMLQLTLEIVEAEALQNLRLLLVAAPDAKGEVLARLRTGEGQGPLVRLGGNFQLDGELAEKIQELPGIARVSLRAKPAGANLRLVA